MKDHVTGLADLLSPQVDGMGGGTAPLRLAIVGLGLIGRRHAAAIRQVDGAEICAIVDLDDGVLATAESVGVRGFRDLTVMLDTVRPDGIILSTPTNLHPAQGAACIEAGIPVLIEKPIADDLQAAQALVQASDAYHVPVMVGHHRRFNPLIQRAKAALDSREIGAIRTVDVKCWFYKPDDYFDTAPWRREKGAGPLSVNLIHDIDLLRYLCGEIASVQAQLSPSARGYAIEDVAAAIVHFENGALGTISVSDSAVSPWSWEFTAAENPVYPVTGESAYQIAGSSGALSIPDLTLWQHDGRPDWWAPLSSTKLSTELSDPLVNQMTHFCAVIRGEIAPLVSAREGMQTLAVVAAMREAAATGRPVRPADLLAAGGGGDAENLNFNIDTVGSFVDESAWNKPAP